MGFPVTYTEMMPPTFLVHLVLLLDRLRRLVTGALDLFGLAHLLLDSSTLPVPIPHVHHRPSPNKPLFAVHVQAALPVTTFGSSSCTWAEEEKGECCYCAVCLNEFSPGEEVRALPSCRHVFHRCCLDPWVELDQRTCPLCRTPLFPDMDDSSSSHSSSSYLYHDNGGDFYDDSLGFDLVR